MRRFFRGLGKFIWRFMVIFSFIVNLVLVIVLIGLGVLIFELKNNVADPLVGGLHSTAIGLENATIDWTIPVRDNIPVDLDIQLNTDTVVVLSEPVPLSVTALIDLPGINAYNVAANVDLSLPAGLELPVALDVPVPVRERLDIALDVRAVIPLRETQLADPIQTLGLLFEPLAVGLHNLPSDFEQARQVVFSLVPLLGGDKTLEDYNLLAMDGSGGINDEAYQAWSGYSQTAGLNYDLLDQWVPTGNRPLETGLVPPGGIPWLDSQLPGRESIYQAMPQDVPLHEVVESYNEQVRGALNAEGIMPVYFNGQMSDYYVEQQQNATPPPQQQLPAQVGNPDVPAVGGPDASAQGNPEPVGTPNPNADAFGIIGTPGN